MTALLKLAFKVSRLRFWIYTAGPYVVGYAMGMTSWLDFLKPEYVVFLAYFFFPANVFLYGVNDYWDQEVDRYNPKKGAKEYKTRKTDERRLRLLLYITGGIGLALLLAQKTLTEQLLLAAFLLLSYFYSAKPVRFKTIPFLDFASNFLYILPGILGYYQASTRLPSVPIVVAGFAHTSAMQIFSAIPDIDYDRQANIVTTAVLLKRRAALLLCAFFWAVLAVFVIALSHQHPVSFLVLIYPATPLLLLFNEDLNINTLYWLYPHINTSLGGLLFATLTLSKAPLF